MHSDIQWFIIFLLVIAAIAYTGWSTRKSGLFFGGATSTAVFVDGGASQPKTKEQAISEEIQRAQSEVGRLEEQVKQAKADADASPLRGKLTITSVSRAGSPGSEYVLIQAARENAAPIVITGLRVRSALTHIGAAIPKAWALPFPGGRGEGEEVALQPGAVAYLITGRPPNGMSFQQNKCIGYLAQGLSFSCPSPLNEPLPPPPNQLSDACLDYIATIPSCSVPSSVPASLAYDGSCQAHVFNKINYNTCVALHKKEPDFYRGDWRIYLGRDTLLWGSRREIVELVDQNNKLIHSFAF